MWERKKLAAMREIQRTALDLFEADGYRHVTVERVAEAARVSPSSVYRYFGTKEMLVLWDEYDPQILDLIRTGGGDWRMSAAELRSAVLVGGTMLVERMLSDPGEEELTKRRYRIVGSEPDVRVGQMRLVAEMEGHIRRLLVERITGIDEFTARFAAAQATWGFSAAVDHWLETDFADPLGDILRRTIDYIDRALAGVLVTDQPNTTSQTAT